MPCDCLPTPPEGMERLTIHLFASKTLLDGDPIVAEIIGEDARKVAIAATRKRNEMCRHCKGTGVERELASDALSGPMADPCYECGGSGYASKEA